jgi:dephospho-CoA kinase
MECALLYEARFENEVDCTLVVTASEETRIRRVMQRDGITEETVRKWIGMQMSEEEKTRRADFVIYNDGNTDIDGSIRDITASISLRFGQTM